MKATTQSAVGGRPTEGEPAVTSLELIGAKLQDALRDRDHQPPYVTFTVELMPGEARAILKALALLDIVRKAVKD